MNFIFPPGTDFVDLRWTTRTPVITASSGSFGSVTGISGRVFRLGKIVFEQFQFNVAINGSAAGAILVSTAHVINANTAGIGRENNALGPVFLTAAAGGSSISITQMNNTYPGADGRLFFGTIAYEIA